METGYRAASLFKIDKLAEVLGVEDKALFATYEYDKADGESPSACAVILYKKTPY